MTDIMHMLAQAQVKAQNQGDTNTVKQNDSVASFFNSLAVKSTNSNQKSMPIPIQQNSFTLESIERNIPKLSPPPNQDTQNNNNNNGSQQTTDLMANSPFAKFLNSTNFNTQQRATQEGNNRGSNSNGPAVPPGFNVQPQQSQQPKNSNNIISSNGKETKLITPNMLTTSANNNNNNAERKPQAAAAEPLTKNQLISAFKYLIDNDNDFTKKIHDAYLKSVNNNS